MTPPPVTVEQIYQGGPVVEHSAARLAVGVVVSRSYSRGADDAGAVPADHQGTVAAVGGRCAATSGDRTVFHMGTILLLALAAAVYPQLLAVVVVILTRPRPKPLLWACYLGSLFVALGFGIALLAVFRSSGSVAGTSSHRLGPWAYLVIGVIAVVVAMLAATRRGRGVFGRDLSRPRRRDQSSLDAPRAARRVTSRAHRALREGSLAFAAVVGAVLAVPGPFDLLAFGRMARGGYATVELGAMIVVFTLVKFLLIEVPIVSYVISPTRTSAQVDRLSGWMAANKLELIATVVGLIGVVLIVRGIVGLV